MMVELRPLLGSPGTLSTTLGHSFGNFWAIAELPRIVGGELFGTHGASVALGYFDPLCHNQPLRGRRHQKPRELAGCVPRVLHARSACPESDSRAHARVPISAFQLWPPRPTQCIGSHAKPPDPPGLACACPHCEDGGIAWVDDPTKQVSGGVTAGSSYQDRRPQSTPGVSGG